MTCPRSYGKKQVTTLIVYSSPTGSWVRVNSQQGVRVNGLATAQHGKALHATRLHVIDVTQMS